MRYALGLVAVLSAGTALAQQPIAPRADYFPLNKGSKWVYKVADNEVTVAVAGTERVGGEDWVRVETQVGQKELKTSEHFAVRADGMYRVKIKEAVIDPPVKVLPIPAEVGMTWQLNSNVVGQTVNGTFAVKNDPERVTVPAGAFDALFVEGKDVNIAGAKATLRFWYAKDRGMVKQEFVLQTNEKVVLELLRYEPGEVPSPSPTPAPEAVPPWAFAGPCHIVPRCTFIPVTTQESRGCCARSVRCWVRRR